GIRDLIVTGVQTCALPILNERAEPHAMSWCSLLFVLPPLASPCGSLRLLPREPLLSLLPRSPEAESGSWIQCAASESPVIQSTRSEERRVGKEGRSRGLPE